MAYSRHTAGARKRHKSCSAQAAEDPPTRPEGQPPRVFARPLAYGSVTVDECRHGGCGAAFRPACGWPSSAPTRTRTPQCGTLHWGSPAGSSTCVSSGMVESSSTWRDELAWWRAEVPPASAACAQGPLLFAGTGLDVASVRQDGAGARHTGPSNTAVEGAPDALPAAPPAGPQMWRCILAMELCEAGACVRAARQSLLGGQQRHVRYPRNGHSGCLRVPAHKRPGDQTAHRALPASSVLRGLYVASRLRCQCDADGGRAGTLEQVLQRGLLHDPSRRPRLQPLLAIALDVAEALVYLHKYRSSMVPARHCAASWDWLLTCSCSCVLGLKTRAWRFGGGGRACRLAALLMASAPGVGRPVGQSQAHCRNACLACALCCTSQWRLNGKLRYGVRACRVAHL